jgi:hypothetical protein
VSRGNAFSEGLVEVQIVVEGVRKAGYVDKKGKWVIEPQVAWRGTAFSEDLAAVQDVKTGKWGYIDTSGAGREGLPSFRSAVGDSGCDCIHPRRGWPRMDGIPAGLHVRCICGACSQRRRCRISWREAYEQFGALISIA